MAPVTLSDLERLAEIARGDRLRQFARGRSWTPYRERLICVALCQGAALHYVDGSNGVKDFDVWTFFAELPENPRPDPGLYRRRGEADFGSSAHGRHPADAGFIGRRVDLLARAIPDEPGVYARQTVGKWLAEGRAQSQRMLAEKVVVLIEPDPGTVIWPPRRP